MKATLCIGSKLNSSDPILSFFLFSSRDLSDLSSHSLWTKNSCFALLTLFTRPCTQWISVHPVCELVSLYSISSDKYFLQMFAALPCGSHVCTDWRSVHAPVKRCNCWNNSNTIISPCIIFVLSNRLCELRLLNCFEFNALTSNIN